MEVFLYGGGITVKDTSGYVNAIHNTPRPRLRR